MISAVVLKRNGEDINIISQTENFVKEITVHVISVQLLINIVGYCLQSGYSYGTGRPTYICY